MTQPKALYLADILEDAGNPADIAESAAAELRRIHAELERCKQVCAATAEGWRVERDALLDALNAALPIIEHERFKQDAAYGNNFVQAKADRARSAHDQALAAIAKAEETK